MDLMEGTMPFGAIKFTRLDRSELQRAARAVQAPDAGEAEQGVLVAGPEAEMSYLLRFVHALLDRRDRDERLVDLLIREVEPDLIDEAHLKQLRLQAQARASFLTQVPLLDSSKVAELLGSTARNTSAMASRLKRSGKLFAVTYKGVDLYPAAQIVDGEPSPAVERILHAFEGDSAWTIALWLNAPSGWLGGERPLDLLAEQPDRVVEAARKTTEPLAV